MKNDATLETFAIVLELMQDISCDQVRLRRKKEFMGDRGLKMQRLITS